MRLTARRPQNDRRHPLWVALLALVVLLGSLDLHLEGEPHPLYAPAGGSEYSPEAAHPTQPIHFEPGSVVSRPHCPVCIQRLQLGGLHLPVTAELAPPAPRSLLAAAPALPPLRGSLRPSGARAPPLS